MKKTAIRFLSAALAIVLCMSLGSFAAFATEEAPEEKIETIWHGDEVANEVVAGKNGYTHLSVYASPYHAYEMSNHMVSDGTTNSIPQTLIMVDANKDYTWTPNGQYTFGSSNYEVLYCCDAVTGYSNGIYYKRMNLEDSDYYTAEEAAHIRAIITNSYPFVSLEQMKQNLANEGFEGAEDLDRAEIITAVQAAVWYFANGVDYRYMQTFNVAKNSQWGGVMHDFSAEMSAEIQALGKRKFLVDEAVGTRINALIDHLKAMDGVYAEKNEIVISGIEVLDTAPVQEKNGVYSVALRVALNNSGSSELDNISLNIYVGDTLVSTQAVELGTNEYQLIVEATANDVIKAVVSGTQVLPQGVYFYEPEGGRDISQCLVGVAAGETDVYAEATVTPEYPEETPNTFALSIKKVDELGNALTGVGFDLFFCTEESNYLIGSYDVDENGFINVNDLMPGLYVLSETKTPDAYMTLSGNIVFTINEEGMLEDADLPAGVSINESTGMIEITVVNTRVSTQVILDGTKYLDGEEAGGFEFALMQGGEILQTVLSGENGIFTFAELIFTEEGVYTYEIVEIAGDAENIFYDETVFTVTITVVREGRELIATVEGAESIEFFNETLVELPDPEPPLGPPQTGDAISTAIAAALASLMGICILPKRKHN